MHAIKLQGNSSMVHALASGSRPPTATSTTWPLHLQARSKVEIAAAHPRKAGTGPNLLWSLHLCVSEHAHAQAPKKKSTVASGTKTFAWPPHIENGSCTRDGARLKLPLCIAVTVRTCTTTTSTWIALPLIGPVRLVPICQPKSRPKLWRAMSQNTSNLGFRLTIHPILQANNAFWNWTQNWPRWKGRNRHRHPRTKPSHRRQLGRQQPNCSSFAWSNSLST